MVKSEPKLRKRNCFCRANFAFLTALNIGTFHGNERHSEGSKPNISFAFLFSFQLSVKFFYALISMTPRDNCKNNIFGAQNGPKLSLFFTHRFDLHAWVTSTLLLQAGLTSSTLPRPSGNGGYSQNGAGWGLRGTFAHGFMLDVWQVACGREKLTFATLRFAPFA